MKDDRIIQEHEDLEDRIYLSTEIHFDTEGATYTGLNPLEFAIKKKIIPPKIESVEYVRRDRKPDRGLF